MKGYLITTADAFEVDVETDLDSLYRILGCDTIDIVHIAPGLVAVVDDEGYLNDCPKTTAIMFAGQQSEMCLVGSILIFADGDGDLAPLSVQQINTLYRWTVFIDDGRRPILVVP